MSAAVAERAQGMAESAAVHDFTKGLWVPPATRPKPARNDGLSYRSEEDAFPRVTPRHQPLGNLVQVMLRVPLVQTDSGFMRHGEERQTERDNMQVAKVIAVGPLAFRNRNTYESMAGRRLVRRRRLCPGAEAPGRLLGREVHPHGGAARGRHAGDRGLASSSPTSRTWRCSASTGRRMVRRMPRPRWPSGTSNERRQPRTDPRSDPASRR